MKKRYLLPLLLAVSAPALADDLPIPPMPPANPPVSDVAPMPDLTINGPIAPASDTPNLNVKFYRQNTFDPSQGFTPGSRYQSTEDRKAIQTPGFSLTVPIR